MVCSIRYSSSTKIVHLMTLTFLWQSQIWESAKALGLMESFECFGKKIRVVLMSTLRFMSSRGQGHCLTFDPGLS